VLKETRKCLLLNLKTSEIHPYKKKRLCLFFSKILREFEKYSFYFSVVEEIILKNFNVLPYCTVESDHSRTKIIVALGKIIFCIIYAIQFKFIFINFSVSIFLGGFFIYC